MESSMIEVNWEIGTEYIVVDVSSLTEKVAIHTTREWRPADGRTINYNTTSEILRHKNGILKITLTYSKENNRHIDGDIGLWGISTIVIRKNSTEGSATWEDFYDSGCNGKVSCNVIQKALYKEPKLQQTTKKELQRQQEKFRAALLCFDQKCTLTGETTSVVLEAAHIIPSKKYGAEVIENGILLRADLHLLYDRGCFLLDENGYVVQVQDNVSEQYKKLLLGAQLPPETTQRVRDALKVEWKNRAHQCV